MTIRESRRCMIFEFSELRINQSIGNVNVTVSRHLCQHSPPFSTLWESKSNVSQIQS